MRAFGWILVVLLAAACGATGTSGKGGGTAGGGGEGATGGTGGGGGTGGSTSAPVAASERAVEFASKADDAFVHVGTLAVPEHLEGQKLPAVILAHGSGPNSRDEAMAGQLGMGFGFSIPVFAELADALAGAGYVVLRFDKRTCGPFNGCAENGYARPSADVTLHTFVDDVDGGLAFLAAQPEVDPQRLFVIGHSKGAMYVPTLMSRNAGVRGGVMLAGPYRPVDDLMHAQAEKLAEVLRLAGTSEAAIDQQLAGLRGLVANLRELEAGTYAGATIEGQPLAYWQSWFDLADEAKSVGPALDRPLLAISGDYDWNVPPGETESWAAAFEGSALHRAQVVPCVTHALNCVSQPDPLRIRPADIGRSVDPAVIEALVGFLDGAAQ